MYSRWRPRWPLMWPAANTQLKPTATGTSHRVCHTVNRSSDITWPTTLHPRNEKLPLQPGLLKPTVLTSDLWGFTDARRTTVPNAQQLYIRSSMFKVWPRGQLLPMVTFYIWPTTIVKKWHKMFICNSFQWLIVKQLGRPNIRGTRQTRSYPDVAFTKTTRTRGENRRENVYFLLPRLWCSDFVTKKKKKKSWLFVVWCWCISRSAWPSGTESVCENEHTKRQAVEQTPLWGFIQPLCRSGTWELTL